MDQRTLQRQRHFSHNAMAAPLIEVASGFLHADGGLGQHRFEVAVIRPTTHLIVEWTNTERKHCVNPTFKYAPVSNPSIRCKAGAPELSGPVCRISMQ
jgi:hypothetical protein